MSQIATDNREWFQEWANEYDNTLGKVQRHHKLLDLVISESGVKKNDQVLEIGCGTGLLSLKFLNKAECSVTAIDSQSPDARDIPGKDRNLQINWGNSLSYANVGGRHGVQIPGV